MFKIRFKGTEYWFRGDDLETHGTIVPLHHCDDKGRILPYHTFSRSFGHYYHGKGLLRDGHKIGDRKDIEIIK